jgi:hypothetical protein
MEPARVSVQPSGTPGARRLYSPLGVSKTPEKREPEAETDEATQDLVREPELEPGSELEHEPEDDPGPEPEPEPEHELEPAAEAEAEAEPEPEPADDQSVAAVEASEPVVPDPETWSASLVRGPADPPPRVRAEFPIVFRGYDREVVDAHLAAVEEDVIELHATRSPQAAIKRELDRVGQETAAILQRAHEAADEVARRSRTRAESRVEDAEREAERITREAEAKLRQLDRDTDEVWAERRRLLEDARAMGESLLELAEQALGRFPPADEGGPPPEPPPPKGAAKRPPASPSAPPPPPKLEEVPPPDEPEPTSLVDDPTGLVDEPERTELVDEPDAAGESVRRIPRPGAPRHPRLPSQRR